MTAISRTAVATAPPDDVWAVLADVAAIATWAPNVDHSSLLQRGPDGIGLVRRVQVGRATLLERIVLWDPPTALAYDIEGLPPAIRSMRNRWDVARRAHGTSLVTLTTTVDAGPRPPQQAIARLACRLAARKSDVMLAGLVAYLEDQRRVRPT